MKRKGKNATKQKGFQNVVVAIDKKICRYQKDNQIPYNSFVEFGTERPYYCKLPTIYTSRERRDYV
jgi:hypothetical protein